MTDDEREQKQRRDADRRRLFPVAWAHCLREGLTKTAAYQAMRMTNEAIEALDAEERKT